MSEIGRLQSKTARLGGYRVLLAAALLFHLSLLVSWRVGFWNGYTFDSTATAGRRGWDFYALYQAGHNVLTDISIYQSDNDKIDVVVPLYTPYRYLPLPAVTLGVLSNLVSPLWAFRLWVAAVEVVLLACAYLSWRLGGGGRRGVLLAALWLCFTPFYLELYLGQFTLVQAALIFGMMLLSARPAMGARFHAIWAASLLWKQNTGLFLPLYLRLKQWRALFLVGAAVVALSAPYFLFYPDALPAFLGNFSSGQPAPNLGNLGVRQFLYSVTSALAPAMSPQAHTLLQNGWVALVVVVGLWLTWRDRRPDIVLHLCFWTTTYFLVYHQVWEHHYLLLLPVFVLLYHRTGSWVVLLLYALVAIWTPYRLIDPQGIAAIHGPMRWIPLEPRIVDVLYHASKAVPALALWGYCLSLIRRTHLLPAEHMP